MKGVQFEDPCEFQDDSRRFKAVTDFQAQEIYSLGPEAFADLEVPETWSKHEEIRFKTFLQILKS